MPTWTGMALLGLLAALAVAGIVVWAWQQSRRNVPPSLRSPRRASDGSHGSEAPYSAENSATFTRNHVGGSGSPGA